MTGVSEDSSQALAIESELAPATADFEEFVKVLQSSSVELLESASEIGVGFLHRLRSTLDSAGPAKSEAQNWVRRVQHILSEKQSSGAVIAVLGGTGVGKSSIINAILDEDRLVPTNCVRACTACAIEIPYNASNDPAQLYRAEIEFISAEEWIADLSSSLGDIDGCAGECTQANTRIDAEAEIAWAKISAVYPGISKMDIQCYDSTELSQQPEVSKVLGTTNLLHTRDAAQLYEQLRVFVSGRRKPASQAMELWPLVKRIRVFTKARALTTGAVIVDLPGTEDTNAARAAVAARYLEKATRFWIVAPIIRAINDKTAKCLLGDAFKRQLKLDGNFSAITFICSKTDGIVDDDARLEEEIKGLTEKYALLQEEAQEHAKQKEVADKNADFYEDLVGRIEKGQTVSAPCLRGLSTRDQHEEASSPHSQTAGSGPISWRRDGGDATLDICNEVDGGRGGTENDESQQSRSLLTLEKAQEMVNCSKLAKKHHRERKEAIEHELANISADIEARRVLLKQLDDEAALDYQTDRDPSQNIRDYESIAESLPVFCCSADAYQKSRGKSRRDHSILHGFPTVEDTGIPGLRDHLMQSTMSARRRVASQFLTDLAKLAMSLRMWHANSGPLLDRTEARVRKLLLTSQVKLLEDVSLFLHNFSAMVKSNEVTDIIAQNLLEAVDAFIHKLKRMLQRQIYRTFDSVVRKSHSEALKTAASWGGPRPVGMSYPTYTATCRRDGVFKGQNGPRDLNQEILDPVLKGIGAPWEEMFTRLTPLALQKFSKACVSDLETFRLDTEDLLESPQARRKLRDLLCAHQASATVLLEETTGRICETQRSANRSFYPVIQECLRPAYHFCAAVKGRGSLRRMNDHMSFHVRHTGKGMFRDSNEAVQAKLDCMCDEVKAFMRESIQTAVIDIAQDCKSAMGGFNKKNARALKAQISQSLAEFRALFEDVLPMP